jgi:hypothetical protein
MAKRGENSIRNISGKLIIPSNLKIRNKSVKNSKEVVVKS